MKGEHKMLNKLSLGTAILVSTLFIVPVIYAEEWRDDFDGPNLDPAWTLDDMGADPTLKISFEADKLVMFLKGKHEWWGDPEFVEDALKVTQPVPAGDWTVTTHVSYTWEAMPVTNCGIGGLIYYTPGAPPNFIMMMKHKDTIMQEGWNHGKVYKNVALPLGGETDMFLKVDKVGIKSTFSYKLKEADEWIEVGSVDQAVEDGRIGLYVKAYCDVPDITMSVDFFSISGDQVKGAAVQPQDKLAASWGEIKVIY